MSAGTRREREMADFRVALEKQLGDQRADFRDVSLSNFDVLHKSVQESLNKQSMTLTQQLELLQRQNDARLQEIRANVETKLKENFEQNFGAFKEMSQGLTQLTSSADQMLKISEQVAELNQILASPKLQGNFGEMALQKLLEDVLSENGFEWQPRLAEGCQPDATIKIKDMRLCIDAKFPKDRMAAVLDAAQDEAAREQARKELGRVVRDMASDISKKYIRPDLGTTDQAFMFVPSEGLYLEILRMPDILEHCRKVKVTVVSPNTLTATFYAVALAFRGYEMQQSAQALLKSIADMQRHFEGFRKDFDNLGMRLRQAQEDYTKATHDIDRFDRTLVKLRDGQQEKIEE
ncbi:MAG: DNA recombination protein RmuC [Verrucomicrobiota bacterium]